MTDRAPPPPIDATTCDQRVDNYLFKMLKGVPKARIYRAVRNGEVRVNGGRVKVTYRLQVDDQVRIPPLRARTPGQTAVPPNLLQHIAVLYEDEEVLVVNKPAGLAVHKGSGLDYGLIEAMRTLRPNTRYLELAHRLDRATSGCLILAKTRPALVQIQAALNARDQVEKTYLALVRGQWHVTEHIVDYPLVRTDNGAMTIADPATGKPSTTLISTQAHYDTATLIRLTLHTGRTHQARVHCSASDHPIAGDPRYGDPTFNQTLQALGLGRLFLHAHRLTLPHPRYDQPLVVESPLPSGLVEVLERLE